MHELCIISSEREAFKGPCFNDLHNVARDNKWKDKVRRLTFRVITGVLKNPFNNIPCLSSTARRKNNEAKVLHEGQNINVSIDLRTQNN